MSDEAGALVHRLTLPAAASGLAEGGAEVTLQLALNSAEDLVIARHSILAGRFPGKTRSVRLQATNWSLAKGASP